MENSMSVMISILKYFTVKILPTYYVSSFQNSMSNYGYRIRIHKTSFKSFQGGKREVVSHHLLGFAPSAPNILANKDSLYLSPKLVERGFNKAKNKVSSTTHPTHQLRPEITEVSSHHPHSRKLTMRRSSGDLWIPIYIQLHKSYRAAMTIIADFFCRKI